MTPDREDKNIYALLLLTELYLDRLIGVLNYHA